MIFESDFVKRVQKVFVTFSFSSPQGDRGFDGLAGLPGEKGHRVSPLFSLVFFVIGAVNGVCVLDLMCAAV